MSRISRPQPDKVLGEPPQLGVEARPEFRVLQRGEEQQHRRCRNTDGAIRDAGGHPDVIHTAASAGQHTHRAPIAQAGQVGAGAGQQRQMERTLTAVAAAAEQQPTIVPDHRHDGAVLEHRGRLHIGGHKPGVVVEHEVEHLAPLGPVPRHPAQVEEGRHHHGLGFAALGDQPLAGLLQPPTGLQSQQGRQDPHHHEGGDAGAMPAQHGALLLEPAPQPQGLAARAAEAPGRPRGLRQWLRIATKSDPMRRAECHAQG